MKRLTERIDYLERELQQVCNKNNSKFSFQNKNKKKMFYYF
jgi:hypothetical protein